jgi:hypothetical protein
MALIDADPYSRRVIGCGIEGHKTLEHLHPDRAGRKCPVSLYDRVIHTPSAFRRGDRALDNGTRVASVLSSPDLFRGSTEAPVYVFTSGKVLGSGPSTGSEDDVERCRPHRSALCRAGIAAGVPRTTQHTALGAERPGVQNGGMDSYTP